MDNTNHRRFARYATGQATPEEVRKLESIAANDAELAARLSLLKFVANEDSGSEEGSHVSPTLLFNAPYHASRWGYRRILATAAVLLLAVGLSWAGWKAMAPKPLLHDDFAKNWGDGNLWLTPRRTVTVESGHLRLFDRGYLVTKNEYSGPIDVRFRWKWTDLAGDFLYRDELSVVLRTSGSPRELFPHEIQDGLKISLNATAGFVSATVINDANPDPSPVQPRIALAAETWFCIRITDDGNVVRVYVAPERAGAEGLKNPIATFSIPDYSRVHHVAFYNRERLASASHESWLDDITIYRFHPDPTPPDQPGGMPK